MQCSPGDLIRLPILLHCPCSASHLEQQDGRCQRQQQASLPDFNLAKEAKPQTFRSQITNMTQIILAYLVIMFTISCCVVKPCVPKCAHCRLGWLRSRSNALLSSLNLLVHEVLVHVNGTLTGPCPPPDLLDAFVQSL